MAKKISDEISDELREWCESENGTGCGGFVTKKISDELREFIDEGDLYPSYIAELRRIADRIDAEMVELPKDKDGVPIHAGDVVYGDDGKAWRVHEIVLLAVTESVRKFSVKAVCDDGAKRGLRPEWLSHERPDSFELIADELEKWCDAVDVDRNACDVPRDLAKRIRRLAAKEGQK